MISFLVYSIAVLAVAFFGGVAMGAEEAQSIRTPDGAKLTFLGVTRGKHHKAPEYEWLRTGNWIFTPTNTTVAWIKVEQGREQRPHYELLVSDPRNTGCVVTEMKTSSHVERGVDLKGFVLNAYPRSEKETILRLRPYRGEIFGGQFVLTNETQSVPANWTAEVLPKSKSDGDLEVTLTWVQMGVPAPRRREDPEPTNDALNQCVRVGLQLLEKGQPTTAWKAGLIQTFDGTGNFVQSVLSQYPRDGIYDYPSTGHAGSSESDGYFYRPGLWPGVVPWKLRLEFNRVSDFSENEIVTLSNLTVQAGTQEDFESQWTWNQSETNHSFTAVAVNGLRLKVLRPLLIPDRWEPAQKRISVIIYADDDAKAQQMLMTLLRAVDETGQEVHTPFPVAWSGHFSLDFPNARAPKTLSLKLALHKKRFVEFTVNPMEFPFGKGR